MRDVHPRKGWIPDYLAYPALLASRGEPFPDNDLDRPPAQSLQRARDPRVSLLFSDPTASGLADPPAVLVQGDAEAPDEVTALIEGFEEDLRRLFRRQPASGFYSSNPLTRYLFDWYYMRLLIHVTPRRILWWHKGDFGGAPLEAYRVG